MADTIQVGQPAPDFTLRDEQNQEVKLSDLRGQKVVLMFYPLDFSPVCQNEMCEVRDRWSDWEGTGGGGVRHFPRQRLDTQGVEGAAGLQAPPAGRYERRRCAPVRRLE